ncbi:MAG: nucleotide sugar dehydrogenase, partial [Alteraurantiacibacter sp. bin_em_oilr2.035]|nr:nucleotide sugar dehydrogenase [Alteraurantiacibacter sp. bin_em_oilr2.035]
KVREVIGFDIDRERIAQLIDGHDRTEEVEVEELAMARGLRFSCDEPDLERAEIFIISVPTPIDAYNQPDLEPLLSATRMVGQYLRKGDIVIYESTVYPGATEEDCVPVLEQASTLIFNSDFFCGYSPERINPGDKSHRLPSILKVTSGSTTEIAEEVDELYRSIIRAGTHLAPSIKVAEAAKVIENTQRDLNIALVNELAIIFNRLGIDTEAVLEAAGTKWNFIPFRPGLVGGHCIGVDPYYLTHKAEAIGYHPQVILAGRRINDGMGAYVAGQLVKAMLRQRIHVQGSKILVLGLAFKENCPDLRNSRVVDVVAELSDYNAEIHIFDPLVDACEAKKVYGMDLIASPEVGFYDAIILAVAHDEFRKMGSATIRKFGKDDHILYDLKHFYSASESDLRL